MSGVPYVFGNATTSIPLSQLDVNFATNATIGTTSVGLGNTTTTLVGLTNVSTTVVNTSNVSANTSLLLQTNGTTTAVTIDTAQNVGIGTSSPAVKLDVVGASGSGYFKFKGGATGSGFGSFVNAAGTTIGYLGNGGSGSSNAGTAADFAIRYEANLLFAAGGSSTAAMTLDASGNFSIAQTPGGLNNANSYCLNNNGAIYQSHVSGSGSGYAYNNFGYAGTAIGSITQAGTTAVLYNTTSDYRLKSNVVPVTTGLSVINQLNPVNFTWISDNESDTGFLAHEFQTVIPRAVTGTKDATIEEEYEVTPAVKDEQGNITTPAVMGTRTVPVYQQMDNSGAVPYLVAAIKELSAQVTALQAKVGV